MKRSLIAILCLFAVMLTACGDSSSSTAAPAADSSAAESKAADNFGYVLPADAVTPDFTKDDPSDSSIQFEFDIQGRIATYKYSAGGKNMMVSYVYKDGFVQIYGFADDFVGDDKQITLPEFDASVGFTTYEGYFFKGYKF